MALKYKTFDEYRNTIAPHLDAMITSRQDPECEIVLAHAFLLYSFMIEDMQAEATSHKEILDKIGIMLVELQDVLRGIVQGMNMVSPVVLATLLRVSFEVRCNLEFIFSRADPGLYADRWARFARVSELAHDESLEPAERRVKPETRAQIVRDCSEWITVKPDGTLHFGQNWTAEKAFKSLKKRAEALGLGSEYRGNYAATSQFIHGTALLWNGYRAPDGTIGPIGATDQCRRLAMLAVMHCMRSVRAAASFFGLKLDEAEYEPWRQAWLRIARKMGV